MLAPGLSKSARRAQFTLWDKDIYERKNIDRQLFSQGYIGTPKAEVLNTLYFNDNAIVNLKWFTDTRIIESGAFLIGCPDNHEARLHILNTTDRIEGACLIAGNSDYTSEAFLYHHTWKDKPWDPRILYPEIANPVQSAATSCTGEAVEQDTPQLAGANHMAASLLLWLFTQYKEKTIDSDLPISVKATENGFIVTRRSDYHDA